MGGRAGSRAVAVIAATAMAVPHNRLVKLRATISADSPCGSFPNSWLQIPPGTALYKPSHGVFAPMPADADQRPDPPRPAETPHYHGHRGTAPAALPRRRCRCSNDYELCSRWCLRPARGAASNRWQNSDRKTRFILPAVHAPEARLREVSGLGDAAITELKLIAAASSRVARGQLKQRPAIVVTSA